MKTQSFFCKAGQHWWERESQRGRPPVDCPKHRPARAVKPVRSTEPRSAPAKPQTDHLAEARRKAAETKRRVAIARVLDWRRWLQEDREYQEACSRAELLDQPEPKRPQMYAELPHDHDFNIAREEGAI